MPKFSSISLLWERLKNRMKWKKILMIEMHEFHRMAGAGGEVVVNEISESNSKLDIKTLFLDLGTTR
jgi:hypothetical protein